jgi:hypothetical protein
MAVAEDVASGTGYEGEVRLERAIGECGFRRLNGEVVKTWRDAGEDAREERLG